MRKLLALSLAGLLTACSTHYLKPDTTRQDRDRDYDACVSATEPQPSIARTLAWLTTPGLIIQHQQKMNRINRCMQEQGYDVGGNSPSK